MSDLKDFLKRFQFLIGKVQQYKIKMALVINKDNGFNSS